MMTELDCDLFKKRIIFLDDHLDNALGNKIVKQLCYLANENSDEDITLYINSSGGSVTAGMAIYDAMQRSKCDIKTIATGMAASMAGFLLCCGTKGKRYATPTTDILIHQPHSRLYYKQLTVSEIEIESKHATQTKKQMIKILAYHTNNSLDFIEYIFSKDTFMTPKQAIRYSLIDEIYD